TCCQVSSRRTSAPRMPHPSSKKLCTSFIASSSTLAAPCWRSLRRVEPRAKNLVDLLRVGLAAGRLHHLPDEEPDHLSLAVAVLLHLLGIGAHHIVDERFDRRAIGDLHEAAALDDLLDLAALAPQGLEHLLRDLAGDRPVLDPVE